MAYNEYGQRYAVIRAAAESASLTAAQLEDEAYVMGLIDDEDFSVGYTAYSPEGQVLATWGNAYPVAYEYDDLDRMITMATTRNPDYRTTNLVSLLPAGGSLSTWQPDAEDKIDITKWVYDDATGLLTDKVYSDGKGPEYSYKSDGKLSQRTWARGVTTDYKYDIAGSVTNIVYDDGTPQVIYAYDRLGRRVSASTRAVGGTLVSTNHFAYASTLDLDSEVQNGVIIGRSYDDTGRNSGFDLTPSGGTQASVSISYDYDSYGRFSTLESVIGSDSDTFEYSYLPDAGLISGYTGDIGGTASQLDITRTYELNRNLITAVTNSVGDTTPTVITSFDYVNDALGRRTQRSDYYNDRINNPSTTANSFGYNSFSEVINVTLGANNEYAYDYDPIGNRVEYIENSSTTDYSANSLNQYTSIDDGSAVSPTYDDDGNMLSDGVKGYTWDAENRLVAVTLSGGSVKFVYDHQSRRISKKVYSGTTLTESRGFLYEGWNLISEVIDDQTTLSTNVYVWGLDLSGTLQGAGGVGGLLSQTEITSSGASSYFPLADANGNCVTYSDDAGNVQAHYTYDAFGNTVSSDGDMEDDFRFRFSSKYLDEETGLIYYGYRYYDFATGRWVSRDPIEELGGFNLYGFVGNEALSFWDFIGLEKGKEDEENKKEKYCCKQKEIDALAREMTNDAIVKTKKTIVKKRTVIPPAKDDPYGKETSLILEFHPEFSGRICCREDGSIYDKGLHQGSIVWQDGDKQFDPRNWDISTNRYMDHMYVIDIANSSKLSLDNNCSEHFRDILKGLGPLSSIDSHGLNTNQVNYVLGYQSGMDPTSIPIIIDEGSLYIHFAHEWWQGSNVSDFTNLVKRLESFEGVTKDKYGKADERSWKHNLRR